MLCIMVHGSNNLHCLSRSSTISKDKATILVNSGHGHIYTINLVGS